MHIVRIDDLDHDGLDDYSKLTDVVLRR
ncbi:MAG TPA: rRNA methyltransferase, partial [Microbacteriaceae bacterium]|nr:rRNA methyltransferase [Microbacteriaceae bacterium]